MIDANILQTALKALKVLRIVAESGRGLSMTEISQKSELTTTITFRILKTLEISGFVQKEEGSKNYVATVGQTGAPPLAGALELLREVSSGPPSGLDERQLLASSNLSLPQIQSALGNLERAQLVEMQPDGHWSVCPRILGYAQGILREDPTLVALRPAMRRLSEETCETITWFRSSGDEQIVVELIPSSKEISYTLPVGSRHPLVRGAGGKAWLAGLPEDEVAEIVPKLIASTEEPALTSAPDLLKELSKIRSSGYAISQNERVENAAAIAAPVWGPNGQLAGVLGIMAPIFRMPEDRSTALGSMLVSLVSNLF